MVSVRVIDVDNANPRFLTTSYHLNISIDTALVSYRFQIDFCLSMIFVLLNICSLNSPQGSELIPSEGRVFGYDQDIGINASIIYSFLNSGKVNDETTVSFDFFCLN